MRDRPRDGEPPDRPPEGDPPGRRPDKVERPYELSKEYQPDRRKVTPIQRRFVREMTDNPPEPTEDIPYSIDFTTGKPADKRPPHIEIDDVGSVHDPLDETRPKDRAGGLAYVDQRDQWSLEHTLAKDADGAFEKFPDPDGEWTDYVNDGGPDVDQFRGNNCLDCSVAALATWYGHPTVAAPRFPDRTPDGRVDIYGGEKQGVDRAEAWTGARYEGFGASDAGLAAIEKKLRDGGHGSSAAIVNAWSTVGAHAWNAFNHNGKIIWYDPQEAVTSDQPVHRGRRVGAVAAICLDSEGKQL